MSLKSISPREAKALADKGALLIDVREQREYAREHIPGSVPHPLSQLKVERPATGDAEIVVFLCASGARTNAFSGSLRESTGCEAYVMAGGMSGWKSAGLPTERPPREPVSVMRQVMMVAGAVAIAGYLLGTRLDPSWHIVSALVGAGLLFAGYSGICPMARVLKKMPWNRDLPATSQSLQ